MEQKAGENKSNNYLTAIHQTDDQYGFAYVDLSTGEMRSTVLKDLTAVENELVATRTKEIVIDESVTAPTRAVIDKLKILQSQQNTVEQRSEFSYVSQNLTADAEIQAVKHLLMYLTVTQKRSLAHLQQSVHYQPADFLRLDRYAKRNLELISNSRTGKKSGTLLWLLDATKTAMGAGC